MNIPLLQKDPSTSLNPGTSFPKQNMAGLFGQALLQKYDIKNEIIEKVKLPLHVSKDFLEKSVTGLKYNTKEQEVVEIFDTSLSGRLTDTRKIFEGLRTKTNTIMKEQNFASSMAEYSSIIYLGCKDGTIHVADSRDDKRPQKRFVPHQGKDVLNLSISDGFLVTLSVRKELAVWDVKHFMESDSDQPEQLKVIEQVTSFELLTKNQKTTLYYCKDSCIYETMIQRGQPVEDGQVSVRELERLERALFTYHSDDGNLLFADKSENVYLLTALEDGQFDAKLLLEKKVGCQVKCLLIKDGIVTVVHNDTQAKETIFTTISLQRLQEDEEEQRKRDEELKKKEAEEEEKKNSMSEGDFKLWKMQQQQIEAAEAATLIKKKETGVVVEEIKEETVISTVLPIGECGGVSFSSSREELLVSGTNCFVIYGGRRWENQLFEVKTESPALKAQFSSNGNIIYIYANNGTLKIMDWKNPKVQYPQPIRDSEIQDAVGTKDGKYFATLSQNQSRITIYSYLDCSILGQYDHMEYTYLMNFSADSSSLVCVQGTSEPHVFNIVLFKVEEKPEQRITVIPCKIQEDYPTQVDASLTKQEIYMIAKSGNSSNLHIYGFDRKVKKTIRDATALSVSTDEKVLAYANTSSQVNMIFIKQKLPDLPTDGSTQRSPSKRLSKSPSRRQVMPDNTVDEKVINTIQLQDNALTIEFYGNNLKIAIQTSAAVIGFDVYTHATLFKIQNAASKLEFRRLQMQFDDFINFCSAASRLCVYDINYSLETDYISLTSKGLKRIDLKINPQHSTPHVVWAAVGNHVVLQQEDRLWFQANPFLHHQVQNELVHSGPFESVEGFFIPTLLGGPKLGNGSFAQIYKQSIVKGKEDVTTMMMPIYPYKLNALHYFAMTSNVAGAEACFANRVKFTLDEFGNSPLDYAIATKDKLIIEAILNGIDQMENEEKIKILRTLPLNLLVEHPAPVLANILLQNGASVPADSKFGKGTTLPTLFPIKGQGFGESGVPYYSVEVAAQIHPPKAVKPKSKYRPVSTFVLNNPVPRNFTEKSLDLLGSIVDCSNDEIVRSKPITLYLNRKWDSYGFNFYFFQFIMFITLLMSLTALDSSQNIWVRYISGILSVTINTYFFIFELFQLAINKLEYFKSGNNILDIARLAAIYTYLLSVVDPNFELPYYVLPATFVLMWFKILSYLSVFKPTRYLIKMIFEIINDINIFLVILFTALFAYAQITYVLTTDPEKKSLNTDLVNSYVLSLGELGGFDEFEYLQFFIFMMFSFLVPLVLMNMLIALMADSYTRVQSNAVAADARSLAEMLQEMEEVFQYIFNLFKPDYIKEEFYYCFVTKVNDEEEEEDWEGTVGQLKRTIEEATAVLETNLVNAVDELAKRNTEKIIDNLLKANKQEMDVIDTIQKLLEKETQAIRVAFEQQMLDESQKVKDQFNRTMKKLEDDAQRFENEFKRTHDKLENDYQEVKNEFKRTHEKMDEESKQVKEEFQRTYAKINEQGVEVKADLKKAHEEIESTSKQMQTEIKIAQEKVEKESKQMKDELKKAHEMITDVNSQVVSTSSNIVQNVQQSTSKTQESLLQKIELQSKEDTTKVESQVEKQTKHHNEMVTFAVDTQKKVTELLSSTSDQQAKLLVLVDELKGMQNKGLQSIKASEEELMRKKEFEKAQNEAVEQIKKLLSDIKAMESDNSSKHAEEKKAQEEKEAQIKKQLQTIQEELEKMQKSEEERLMKLKEQHEKEEQMKKEISQIAKTLEELNQKYDESKK